ncbi:hypothetical protein AURANDRAFT_68415 [Aureococcus anophagefferens]|uniref:Uncharacterized protein n=1 Tax=Aureococcus anophagefferens TaxID=44056 RepID=F0YPK5_AURAN|nr:hypothetical protein AURANDRAFT_68415 [Aureococcus anophagefferens]EGB02957.1 hypothetical protein AURANDRAFT_68415 [Aureococcus anophagefferens]|eukprot:XP_009042347.1 hypothetical protein AURANDRAFT_68415 [Aureococcus anophagefferens]
MLDFRETHWTVCGASLVLLHKAPAAAPTWTLKSSHTIAALRARASIGSPSFVPVPWASRQDRKTRTKPAHCNLLPGNNRQRSNQMHGINHELACIRDGASRLQRSGRRQEQKNTPRSLENKELSSINEPYYTLLAPVHRVIGNLLDEIPRRAMVVRSISGLREHNGSKKFSTKHERGYLIDCWVVECNWIIRTEDCDTKVFSEACIIALGVLVNALRTPYSDANCLTKLRMWNGENKAGCGRSNKIFYQERVDTNSSAKDSSVHSCR